MLGCAVSIHFCLLAVVHYDLLSSPTVSMSCHCSVFLPTLRIIVLFKVLLMTGDVGYLFMCLLAILIAFILANYRRSSLLSQNT